MQTTGRGILVVDDEQDVRGLVVEILERAGYVVTEAVDLAEAHVHLLGQTFDAVVTDLELPDGDGVMLIPFVGSTAPVTRVVCMTGHVTYAQALKCLHAGAYDFIPKPVNRDSLVSAVRRAVEARGREVEYARVLKEARDQMVRAEKMASIGCIAAGVAHEINNPIGFISSNLQTLKGYLEDIRPVIQDLRARADDALEARIKKIDLDYVMGDIEILVRESEDGVKRVVKIVKDLKTFSHHGRNSNTEETDLNGCIETAVNLSRNETKYLAEVTSELGELPKLQAWPTEITQVLVNLIVNAAHAIGDVERATGVVEKELGHITVRSRVQEPWAVIEVQDDGCGIPKEIASRIFDPFFTTKEPGKGTGLGLSLSYEIMKRHHGEITAEPASTGKGTCFQLKVPLALSVAVA